METEQEIVQQEPVSTTEQVSSTAQTTEPVVVAPQPLTEEKVAQMITEATEKAVKEAKELGKRELQSAQDRNKVELAKASRRAQIAETVLGAARQGLDPEVAKELELAEYRAKEQGRVTVEQEEELARQQTEFHEKFQTNLNQFITNLGVDPKDERIDWAADAKDYLEAQQRILASAALIQKENIKATQTSLETRLKALEAKVKAEEIEANSVETSTSQGVVAGSDAEFIKNFAADKIPLTKANVARYHKILEQ